jgi:hypothetical protein
MVAMTVIFPSLYGAENSPSARSGQLWELAKQAGEELDGHGRRVASMVPLILLASGYYTDKWVGNPPIFSRALNENSGSSF